MEVVVIVHAALTTTSEQSQLGVISYSNWKLITSEIPDREQTGCACMFKFNCSKPARNTMGIVDVSENSLTTMSTQLQPDCIRDDDELQCKSTLTRTQPTTLEEEG